MEPKTIINDFENDIYKDFDAPFATVSIYAYNYLFRKGVEAGYDLFFTGSGGDYMQRGNYPHYLYNLADLLKKEDPNFNRELKFWIKNHSTKQFPKSKKIFLNQIKKLVNLNNQGQLIPEYLLFDRSVINSKVAKNDNFLKSKIVKNYGTYSRSFMMQELQYFATPPGAEAEDTMGWLNKFDLCSPFFNKEVVEFAWTLSDNLNIKDGVNKVLYRKAFKKIVPSKIINRISKSGFNAPFDMWVRDELKEFVMDIFTSNSFKKRGIYNYNNFMKLVNEHQKSKNNHMMIIWQALNLELWLKSKKI